MGRGGGGGGGGPGGSGGGSGVGSSGGRASLRRALAALALASVSAAVVFIAFHANPRLQLRARREGEMVGAGVEPDPVVDDAAGDSDDRHLKRELAQVLSRIGKLETVLQGNGNGNDGSGDGTQHDKDKEAEEEEEGGIAKDASSVERLPTITSSTSSTSSRSGGGSSSSASVWFVHDRHFHGPPLFPLCTMDACFDFDRCSRSAVAAARRNKGRERGHVVPLVYTYWDGPNYFENFAKSRWHTDDPNEACFFFVFMSRGHPERFTDLPHWGESGQNHVLVSFSDSWSGPHPRSIGKAMVMLTCAWQTRMRGAFDVSIPLPQKWRDVPKQLFQAHAAHRKYFLTFSGTRYLGDLPGNFRSLPEFKKMHNGRKIIVVTSCGGSTNARILREQPQLLPECEADAQQKKRYSFVDLMNTTFALAPAGRQPSTYRFLEILAAGAIPVVVADNWRLPFDEVIRWHDCMLLFSTSHIRSIVQVLRRIPKRQVRLRQQRCQQLFLAHLSSNERLLETLMASLISHFGGVIPEFV